MTKLNNFWVVRLKKTETTPTFPHFTDLQSAKKYCNSVLSNYGKIKYLDEQDIVHVVNGQMISSVTMDVKDDEIYFSSVHIYCKKNPFIE